MKLTYKVLTIFFILCVFCTSNIYAIDMFLNSASINENTQIVEGEKTAIEGNLTLLTDSSEDSIPETSNENENTMYLTTEKSINSENNYVSSVPVVTTTGVQTDDTLSTSDIINIILIAVCVVLILLAIAILIRCK